MTGLKPSEAATIAHGYWVGKPPEAGLGRFAIDTRKMEAGDTFVALPTDKRDGHAFLQMARRNGALAALVEKADPDLELPQLVVENTYRALHSLARVRRQAFKRPIIGITGSYGKTTVKEQLGRVLGSQWYHTPGNLNNTLGVPLCLLEIESTHDAGAIIEAGISLKGEMEVLADLIDPDISIVTAVGPAHLEALGDLAGVAEEKAKLPQGTREGGTAVIPVDLLHYKHFREIPESVQVHAVALSGTGSPPPELSGNVRIFRYTWEEDIDVPGRGFLCPGNLDGERIIIPGESPGLVSNLSLVVHVALQLGVPAGTIESCLESWKPYSKRGELYQYGNTLYYVDCYNANPGSVPDSVIRFQKLFSKHAHCYVFGSMDELGERSGEWHRMTAERLNLPASAQVHLLGHGAEAFAEGLVKAGFPGRQIHIAASLEEAGDALDGWEGAVFLKGSRQFTLERLVPKGARPC